MVTALFFSLVFSFCYRDPVEAYDGTLCKELRINAAFTTPKNVTTVILDHLFWELPGPSSPHHISHIHAPSDGIDAALTFENKTYFFKGSKYWRNSYKDNSSDADYPKPIFDYFPGIPYDLDAATEWSSTIMYFFKGSKYWKFNTRLVPPVSNDYPKNMSDWKGIPDNVDAVLHPNDGFTYFFKGPVYYKYNDKTHMVENEKPAYPRPIGDWFDCPSRRDTMTDVCKDPSIDAVITISNKYIDSVYTYLFKGNRFWTLEGAGKPGYSKPNSFAWTGLPGDLDAAFEALDDRSIYFFKKTKVWKYSLWKSVIADKEVEDGYPKEISDEFPGIPNDVNAATTWGNRGDIYFFKGASFWRYDPRRTPPVSTSYPKSIHLWKGIPSNVDAILHFKSTNNHTRFIDKYTYFFKDDKYYKFDPYTFMVVDEKPPYPRPTGPTWFGCPKEKS